MRADQSAIASYRPTGAPTTNAVANASVTENSAATSALSTLNGFVRQANTDVTTAYHYGGQANRAGNCGDAPAAPSPQPPLS